MRLRWCLSIALIGCSSSGASRPTPVTAPVAAASIPTAAYPEPGPAPDPALSAALAAISGIGADGDQEGVTMAVDGAPGVAIPAHVRTKPGEHVVRFEGERYEPAEKRVTVAPGEIADLGTVRLRVARGVATIVSKTPDVTVVLENGRGDRRAITTLPIRIDFGAWEKEAWVLHVTKPGYCAYAKAIEFRDGAAEKRLEVELVRGCSP
jgi:hypothetical protein